MVFANEFQLKISLKSSLTWQLIREGIEGKHAIYLFTGVRGLCSASTFPIAEKLCKLDLIPDVWSLLFGFEGSERKIAIGVNLGGD